jgi:aspartate carbamoyltransferase catalytic subunit
MQDLISMRDLGKDDILKFMEIATAIEKGDMKPDMKGKLMAALFFEPSTRTHLSFETAMKRLGGEVISMSGTANTSVSKGETLADTTKVISQYADIIVMRHPLEGAARYVAEHVDIPVINAGDGANQHPTQSLLDVYTILKTQGKLENLNICLVGDLKYGRTVHSLVYALSFFNPRFYFVSPENLRMPEHFLKDFEKLGIKYSEHLTIEEIIGEVDILYMTRIQRERFADMHEYEKVKNLYILNANMLQNVKDNLKVLHPLPRVNEISTDVDSTKYAHYFQQTKNGVYIRQAILTLLLGGVQ